MLTADAAPRSGTTSFINPAAGVTTVPAADTLETADIPNEIGITGTPVIDPATGTMYVVAKTKEVSGARQRTSSVSTRSTSQPAPRSPAVRSSFKPAFPAPATDRRAGRSPSTPSARINGQAAARERRLYLGFSSHGDNEPFHGWVLGYNATNLQQVMAFCTTPNGDDGGVWMNGDGIATDSTGSLYFISGDGAMDADTGGADYGDSFLKLSTSGAVQDYFSPSVQTSLDSGNLDLGAGGVLCCRIRAAPIRTRW